jgi:hypothetical protein
MINNIRTFVHKIAANFPTVFDCIAIRILAARGAALRG